MSQRLIGLSRDLMQLREEGYDLDVQSGNVLLVRDVPYVNRQRQVLRGTLVTQLDLAADETVQPSSHELYFIGEEPCDSQGQPLSRVVAGTGGSVGAVAVNFMFSKKPIGGDGRYADYHHKVTNYVHLLSIHADVVEPGVSARTFPVVTDEDDADSVFEYVDTASVRADILAVTDKLRVGAVAIVGLGGTGAYILDLLAKTPVHEIHLFDGDRFVQHNAFRAPGAASKDDMNPPPQKVNYLAAKYRAMRRDVLPHDTFIDSENVDQLREMSFVFLTVDNGPARKLLVDKLEDFGVPFIDIGLGVENVEGSLTGQVRTTTSTREMRQHVHDLRRIPFAALDEHNDYTRNIQIAELNALNAALAVIRWKKLVGFYSDLEHEHHSVYALNGNAIINEDQA